MYEESLKNLTLKEVHDLIDLYKYASIEGEKVEFSVKSTSDNKRIISIELQNGHERDKDTFVFEDGEFFDDKIYPELLSYFSSDDPLLKWTVTKEEDLYEGFNETQSGDSLYLSTYKENYIESLDEKVEKVKDEETYKKTPLTNEDKIWDEIILYANGRRVMQDFYKGSNFTKEEIEKIYNFVINLAENVKEINYGKSKKARNNNEKYLNDLFNNRQDELEKMGLDSKIINQIKNTSMISKLAVLVGVEKRIRKRLDLDNEEIKNKIEFATSELDKVDFFNLKNASLEQFKDQNFIESKPKALKKLISNLDNKEVYKEETKETYQEYCNQILGYLERKSKNNKKVEKTSLNLEEITFTNHVEGKGNKEEEKEEIISKDEPKETVQKEVTEEDLKKLMKRFSDYMIKQEKEQKVEKPKEEPKKDVILISLGDIDIASYELINDKYKGNYDLDKMPFNERKIVENFYLMRQRLSLIYEDYCKNIDTLSKEEFQMLAKIEVCLMSMTRIEYKYKDKEKAIKYFKETPNIPPAGKLIAKALELNEEDKKGYEEVSNYVNNIAELNINRYEEITKKYNGKVSETDKEKVEEDKDELVKLIAYKMSLTDSYNALLFKKDSLNEEELKKLAECETRLYKIYEIDAEYQDNIDVILDELIDKQEFILPSTKIWVSALSKEKEIRDSKKDNLFEVIEQPKEEKQSIDISNLYDAYEEALSYSTKDTPATIRVNFEKDNKEEANVIISNKVKGENVIVMQKTYSIDDLNKYVMPALREMFLDGNEVAYNIKYDIAGTPDAGLLLLGDEHRSFNITNASKEFVDINKEELDKIIEKNNNLKK